MTEVWTAPHSRDYTGNYGRGSLRPASQQTAPPPPGFLRGQPARASQPAAARPASTPTARPADIAQNDDGSWTQVISPSHRSSNPLPHLLVRARDQHLPSPLSPDPLLTHTQHNVRRSQRVVQGRLDQDLLAWP